jgi:hypothetical protein
MNSQGVICNELNDQLITNGYSQVCVVSRSDQVIGGG